ncbi:MAG: hypothetical protein ABIQ88_12620 [Chitinophagaceae bacterium]
MRFCYGRCFWLLLLIAGNRLYAQGDENIFKKSSFYSVMSENKEDAVNKQLDVLKTTTIKDKDAYEGALLMKKAGFAGSAKKKLNLFKEGHRKLEGILQKDSSNGEFRFLRLMIQEHAPGIVGYKKELQKDRLYIKNNFKTLPPVVQAAVLNYSKESKILKPADL